MTFLYLHEVSPGIFYLDHRLTPEVRAMLAAMASRAPLGGIKARYEQIVRAVAEGLLDEADAKCSPERIQQAKEFVEAMGDSFTRDSRVALRRDQAEDRLCEYPLHPKVQEFFGQFVRDYGHSSIMELTGQPAVYIEGISWFSCYLLFDSPLCAGQEFSTRAVRHKDWPMAREACDYAHDPEFVATETVHEQVGGISVDVEAGDKGLDMWVANSTLRGLHDGWFNVFEEEVEAWRQEFTKPCYVCGGTGKTEHLGWTGTSILPKGPGDCPKCKGTGKNYPGLDKEPFRPALDRARWALPGTIATGCCHTGHLRERARVINDGLALTQNAPSARQTWEAIQEGYRAAIPGLAGLGLREAVYGDTERFLPGHLIPQVREAGEFTSAKVELVSCPQHPLHNAKERRSGSKTYVDPAMNEVRLRITFQCSLAVARDWHRHRTAYPWRLSLLRHVKADIARSAAERAGLFFDEGFYIHPEYEALSKSNQPRVQELLTRSYEAYKRFMAEGDVTKAMMSLPLGTLVEMTCEMGLRDAIYMLELRRDAHGANFEYKAQAAEAMEQIEKLLPEPYLKMCGLR